MAQPRHFPKSLGERGAGCDCGMLFSSRDALAAHIANWCAAMTKVVFSEYAGTRDREAHPLPGHDLVLRRHPLGNWFIQCQCGWESQVLEEVHGKSKKLRIGIVAREHARDAMRRWIYGGYE